jgi:hypothetical protein
VRDPAIGIGPTAGQSPEVDHDRERFLTLLKNNVLRVGDRCGVGLLSNISFVASISSIGYFTQLEHNPNASPEIRKEAAGWRASSELPD